MAADLDGDGYPDLVWAGPTSSNRTGVPSLGVLLNRGDGTFPDQVVYSTAPTAGLAVADFNGDSLLDLADLEPNSSSMGVFLNQSKGTFANAAEYPAGGGKAVAAGLAAGDLNGDHVPDLVFELFVDAFDSVRYLFGVFLNAGDGTLVAMPNVDAAGFLLGSSTIGDLNGDGAGDIVGLHVESPTTIGVFSGNGDGTFSSPVTLNGGACASAAASNIAVADLDGDGRRDLAFFCDSQLRVSLNRGSPGLVAPAASYPASSAVPIAANSQPAVAVGDLNADGYLDVAITDGVSSTVSVFFNRGDGTFVGPAVVATGTGTAPGTVSIADLDGNGISDIVFVDADSNSIGVLLSRCSP